MKLSKNIIRARDIMFAVDNNVGGVRLVVLQAEGEPKFFFVDTKEEWAFEDWFPRNTKTPLITQDTVPTTSEGWPINGDMLADGKVSQPRVNYGYEEGVDYMRLDRVLKKVPVKLLKEMKERFVECPCKIATPTAYHRYNIRQYTLEDLEGFDMTKGIDYSSILR